MNMKRFIVCIYCTQSRCSCFHTGTFTSQVMGCGLYSAGVNVGGGGPPQSSRIWVSHPPAAWAAAKTRGLHILTSSLSVPLLLLPQLLASPILPALPTLSLHLACSLAQPMPPHGFLASGPCSYSLFRGGPALSPISITLLCLICHHLT